MPSRSYSKLRSADREGVMDTKLKADPVLQDRHEVPEASDRISTDLDRIEEPVDTAAIEVILPTIIAEHVKRILIRRGVAIDDFFLDLLVRFVPGVPDILSCEEDSGTSNTA